MTPPRSQPPRFTAPTSFFAIKGFDRLDQIEDVLEIALGKLGFTNADGLWSTPHGDVVINHRGRDQGGDPEKWQNFSFYLGAMDDSCVDVLGSEACDPSAGAVTVPTPDDSAPGQRLSTQTLVFAKSYLVWDTSSSDLEEFDTHWDLTDDPSSMETYSISLPTVLGHELGHALAFDENYEDENAMMYYITGWGETRSPQRFELDALGFVYD